MERADSSRCASAQPDLAGGSRLSGRCRQVQAGAGRCRRHERASKAQRCPTAVSQLRTRGFSVMVASCSLVPSKMRSASSHSSRLSNSPTLRGRGGQVGLSGRPGVVIHVVGALQSVGPACGCAGGQGAAGVSGDRGRMVSCQGPVSRGQGVGSGRWCMSAGRQKVRVIRGVVGPVATGPASPCQSLWAGGPCICCGRLEMASAQCQQCQCQGCSVSSVTSGVLQCHLRRACRLPRLLT
jgi:hypothetical protein